MVGMSKLEKAIRECEDTFDLDRTLLGEYTNYLILGLNQTKDAITKNTLEQLGYDLEEVINTKGKCVIHDIVWFSRAWEHEKVEYLQVDDKVVGEVRLVNASLNYKWEGKIYGKEIGEGDV